mmetsp:Transcript_6757/g.12734  ORF Transcript_6757/g.12734 Transcript_6757/m.12734 type:complete len:83 (-) Transcript_6757:795-1043(-)
MRGNSNWLSSLQVQKEHVSWQRDLMWPLPQYLAMRLSGFAAVSHLQLAISFLSKRKLKVESSSQVTVGGPTMGEAVGKHDGL